MKKFTLVTFLLATLIPSLPVQAQELPDFVVRAVAEVSVYNSKPFEDENKVKQGSGVFVDHGGCLYTNSHVVLNLDIDEVYEHIIISVTEDRDRPPVFLVEGELIYVDQELDLAYVCPKFETDIFTHFFERKKVDNFKSIPFGTEVWIMGHPDAGLETITISPGHIVGFVDEPDTSDWFGVPDLDPKLLRLYKADALSGPGVSGGLLVDKDLQLLGIPFAGSFNAGAFIFALSEGVYLEFDKRLRAYQYLHNLVPSDCVFDLESDYYYRSGVAHYDDQCELPYDELMEREVKSTWTAFCGTEISSQRLVPAVRRSKQLGDLGQWSDNMLLICPGDEEVVDVELVAGDFAYGHSRLASLEEEQALAKSLKAEIDADYPNLQIDAADWSTIVNSYIYGGYPVQAINRTIELGGKTVHPTIPFSSWQNSDDYQNNI